MSDIPRLDIDLFSDDTLGHTSRVYRTLRGAIHQRR